MPLSSPVTKPYVGSDNTLTRYWFGVNAEPAATAAAVTAGRLYLQAVNLPGLTVDRIGIEVTALAAGNCRLGVYDNANGLPGALIVDVGVVSTGANTIVEASFSSALILPEWCFVAAVFDATPTVRVGSAIGASRFGTSTYGGGIRGYISTQAYGALPASVSSPTMTGTVPLIGLRKS